MARQRAPGKRKARVPRGDVRPSRWRELRRMKRMEAKKAIMRERRKARIATTTCRAKTPWTAERTEVKDMVGWCSLSRALEEVILRWEW